MTKKAETCGVVQPLKCESDAFEFRINMKVGLVAWLPDRYCWHPSHSGFGRKLSKCPEHECVVRYVLDE